jgi:hypothetical protein
VSGGVCVAASLTRRGWTAAAGAGGGSTWGGDGEDPAGDMDAAGAWGRGGGDAAAATAGDMDAAGGGTATTGDPVTLMSMGGGVG